MTWKIPLFKPDLGQEELEAIQQPLMENWLAMGPVTEALEAEFSAMVGAPHSVAVTNGTAALHLALVCHGLAPGDEVIVPSMSFVASANAVRYCGASVVYADITSPVKPSIDPADIERRITAKTKAIIVVHYAGFACDMTAILALANQHQLIVIEDCAHALPAGYEGKKLGSLGSTGCFSFYSNKNITCAEGGMIVCHDEQLASELRLRRNHGMSRTTPEDNRPLTVGYDCAVLGFNYRLDEIRASLLRVQLSRLEGFMKARRRIWSAYQHALAQTPVNIVFSEDGEAIRSAGLHIMSVILPEEADRDYVISQLHAAGIQTSMHYPPAHLFSMIDARNRPSLPQTEAMAKRQLTLPFFPSMEQSAVGDVCAALTAALPG